MTNQFEFEKLAIYDKQINSEWFNNAKFCETKDFIDRNIESYT